MKPGYSTLLTDASRLLPILETMQSNGMPVSRYYFEHLRADLDSQLDILGREISQTHYGGRPFNPKSPGKVRTLMRRRGLSGEKTTSTGLVSTEKKSINHLRFSDEAMKAVFDWREMQHVRDSYCKPILAIAPSNNDDDDVYYIHANFKPTKVHTRRLATAKPLNLLAIPIRTDIGQKVREGFRFPPDSPLTFGGYDLSQIEMRCAAHESKDKYLCHTFRSGGDIHTRTAIDVFGVTLEQSKEPKYRVPAKTTNFGLLYGEGAGGLQDQLRMAGIFWTLDRCQEFIDEVSSTRPGFAQYVRDVSEKVKRTGIICDHWGMKRYLPGVFSGEYHLIAEACRQAVSHRIQGLAQGMIQKAMIWLDSVINELRHDGIIVDWRLQVHDEIILSFPSKYAGLVSDLAIEALTKHTGINLIVPVLADGHSAKSWGGLK